MDMPADLQIADGYAVFRPIRELTVASAMVVVSEVIQYCCEHGIKRLLIDGTQVTGLQPPTTTQRYEVNTTWARVSAGAVKLAFVLRPELIDPQKFGMTVARNRGMQADVFVSESEALAWLLDPATD